jgi:hypothetical protein
MNNPAFELIRRHKEVSEETKSLVLKQIKNKVTESELITIFENGISGKYGKLYSADTQTLVGWVERFLKERMSDKNYLESPLSDVNMNENEIWDWNKEVNKCYHAFLKGVSHEYFHHAVYDTMLLDNKIKINAYTKYYRVPDSADPENKLQWDELIREVKKAKRQIIRDVFTKYKSYGYNDIFIIRETY